MHLSRFSALAAHLRPLAVALENVPLAGTTRRFEHFLSLMAALQYRGVWGILNAARRGSTQCRQRLVYIGIREDVGVTPTIAPPSHGGAGVYFSYSTHGMVPIASNTIAMLSESPGARRARKLMPYLETDLGPAQIPAVGDILDGLPPVGTQEAIEMSHERWAHTTEMIARMAQVPEGGQWAGGSDHFSHSYGRLHRHGLARTLTGFFPNPGSGRFWHPTEDRALSLREAARLQGFPDSFRFLGHATKNTRLVGNALDATLAEATLGAIRAALD
jgi:DNA (cytosine-5)-methyltransferase 1